MENYQFYADRSIEQHHKADLIFIASVIMLLGFGVFTQYFCTQSYAARIFGDSFYFVKRQLVCVGVGVIGFLFISSVKIKVLRKMLPTFFWVTLILCILTFVPALSVEKNGARRWLKMPFSFTLQSSELVKFTIVIFLANLFDKQFCIKNETDRNVAPCVGVLLLFTCIIIAQKDLSTALFVFLVCVIMFFASGLNLKWLFALSILAIPALFLFVASEQYRLDRVLAWLFPKLGENTINYQSIAAKRAISAGGFWGNGIGTSLIQANRIPEVQTDYIFAGWSEAMGLSGIIGYFFMLGTFAFRGYKIVFSCNNRFAAYTAFGFVTMILLQSILNCAVVSGALPSTGIPLPFFSLGGSSIIMTLCMCGFIVNASRCEADNYIETEKKYGIAESDFVEIGTFVGL